jgi:predicted nucleic-acid-binding Zn-ribbon protein
MRNGICPKCGHNDIRLGKDVMGGEPAIAFNMVVYTGFRTVYDVYVCINCGYVELAISNHDRLQDIAEDWPQVMPYNTDNTLPD